MMRFPQDSGDDGSDRDRGHTFSAGIPDRIDPSTDPLLRDVPTIEGYKVLGPCVLYRRIGSGGMGVVYQGRHLNLDLEVAVKCLDPSLVGRDGGFVERFQREARVAARINHPNVVRVYDVSEFKGVHYLVMEYVEGEDARRRVIRKGPLPAPEACQIMVGAGSGLAVAHRRGIVHRDVKPDNILVSSDGEVKIADLGLVKILGGKTVVTHDKSRLGTPNYMPLEQWRDMKDVGLTADVWSLGATLYFLLTGEDAIQGESVYAILNHLAEEPFPDVRKRMPDVPGEVVRVIDRATRREPHARYATANEFVAALRGWGHLDGSTLIDPAAMRILDVDEAVSPPSKKILVRIERSLSASSGTNKTGVRKDAGPSRRRKVWFAVGSLSLAVVLVLAYLYSFGDERWGVIFGGKGSERARSFDAQGGRREPVNRTDYLVLWAKKEDGSRTFLKPTVEETVGNVHWFGEASHNLPQIPPVQFAPGEIVDVKMSWEWVDIQDTPITCIDVYGDWMPDAKGPNTSELYHESVVLPAGGPTPHHIAFSFTVPETPGIYRIRWMYTACFDDTYHISSFYGGKQVETNVAPAEAWTEVLFEVVE